MQYRYIVIVNDVVDFKTNSYAEAENYALNYDGEMFERCP